MSIEWAPPVPAADPAFVADATVEIADVSVWFGPKVALSELSRPLRGSRHSSVAHAVSCAKAALGMATAEIASAMADTPRPPTRRVRSATMYSP